MVRGSDWGGITIVIELWGIRGELERGCERSYESCDGVYVMEGGGRTEIKRSKGRWWGLGAKPNTHVEASGHRRAREWRCVIQQRYYASSEIELFSTDCR